MTMMVAQLTRKAFARLNGVADDDRGAVFWYGAIIIFIALALIGGIWDTSNFINYKISAQNSADAAALEFSAWQARGMNAVQEANNDIYEIDTMISATMIATSIALGLYNTVMAGLFIGIITIPAGKAMLNFRDGTLATIFKVIFGVLRGLRIVTVNAMNVVRVFYIYGANIIGYLGAQRVAKLNGASPIVGQEITGKIQQHFTKRNGQEQQDEDREDNNISKFRSPFGKAITNMMKDFRAIGIPVDGNPLKLPVAKAKKEDQPAPLQAKKDLAYKIAIGHMRVMWPRVKSSLGDWVYWQDTCYESTLQKADERYPTWLWFTRCEPPSPTKGHLLLWKKDLQKSMPPGAFAYALCQIRGGNVVRYSGSSKVRPSGYGAAIEPMLVSLSDTKWKDGIKKALSGLLFMH